jgi:hypothetical protein
LKAAVERVTDKALNVAVPKEHGSYSASVRKILKSLVEKQD